MKKTVSGILFLIFINFIYASPYTPESIPDVRLQNKYNHVSNPDGIIESSDVQGINSLLNSLEDSLTIEVQVVAVQSIGEEDTRMFANKLFNYWGIGLKGKDNGLLILLVIDQREVVFETGYGLEDILPDALCSRMQQKYMVPYLKNDEYSVSMLKGVEVVTDYLLNSQYSVANSVENRNDMKSWWKEAIQSSTFRIFAVVYLLLTFFFLRNFITKTKNQVDKKQCSTENFVNVENSFSLVGLGCLFIFFPIAGAISFLWYYTFYRGVLLKNSSECPSCKQNTVKLLSGKEKASHLTQSENLEAKLKTIRYYVFFCSNCSNISKHSISTGYDKYQKCPHCGTFAYSATKRKKIKKATFSSGGMCGVTYVCKMCDYTEKTNESIPIKSIDSGSSRRSRKSSTHSSHSSGSSHGGGRSGGGGARSKF